jgi:pyruvate dehydrogenase E1 component
VTIADAAPASLSWLGGVLGQRVAPLGVERFGQTGNLADLYSAYRLDGSAITEAAAEILLQDR